MTNTKLEFRGLVLSATELRQMHPEWSGAFIEDYLSLIENLVLVSDKLDTEIDRLLEEIATDFADGSIPVASGGLVTQSIGLSFDLLKNALFVAGDIRGKNRAKQFYFSGF